MIAFKIWRFLIQLYFRSIQVNGECPLPEDGPILFVSNHTNAFVDPFILSEAVNRPLRITAKASLFKNPFLWILCKLFRVVPFVRKEDAGSLREQEKNHDSFEACERALSQGDSLCIFPEGKSHSQPQLLPFKTGVARIAIDYVDKFGPLTIIPAGIYYESKSGFGSRVIVELGKLLNVIAWKQEYPQGNFRDLTKDIETRVHELTLQFERNRDSVLLTWASDLYQRHGIDPEPLDHKDVLPKDFIGVTQRLTKSYYELKDKREVKEAESAIFHLRKRLRLSGLTINDIYLPLNTGKVLFFLFRELELIIFGTPIFLFGCAMHLFPLGILMAVVPKISKDQDHWATNYLFLGAGLLFVYYGFIFFAFSITKPLLGLVILGIMAYSIYFAILFSQRIIRSIHRIKAFSVLFFKPRLRAELQAEANDILGIINHIKLQYLGK